MIFKKHMLGKTLLGLLFLGFIPLMSSLKFVKSTEVENPYFHVLFHADEQADLMNAKLQKIPGIENVVSISPEEIRRKLKNSLSSDSMSLMNEIDFEYTGLTVSISQELKGKAKELLKKYIKKMAGDDIEISQIYHPKAMEFSQLGYLADIRIQLGLMFLLWLFMCSIFSKQERNFLYLSRQFHRGKAVAYKTYAFNFILYVGLFSLVFALVHNLKFKNELMFFVLACLTFGMAPYFQKLTWKA